MTDEEVKLIPLTEEKPRELEVTEKTADKMQNQVQELGEMWQAVMADAPVTTPTQKFITPGGRFAIPGRGKLGTGFGSSSQPNIKSKLSQSMIQVATDREQFDVHNLTAGDIEPVEKVQNQ